MRNGRKAKQGEERKGGCKGTRRVRTEQVVTPSSSSLPPSSFVFPHCYFLYICVLFFFSFCISLFYFSQLCIHPLFSIPPSTLPPSPPPSLSLPQPVFSSIAFPSFCSPHFHPVQTSLCVNGPDRAGPCVFSPPFIGLSCS